MKIAFVLGTRPEIIKMSPIIHECEKRGIDYFVLHTGQHYDYLMDKIFFEELGLKPETINLDVGSGTHGKITGKIIIGMEKILMDKKPDVTLVQGDTNTVLAGSLVSVKLHIPLGHVEAGLRSYDRRLPEEYNRIISDHISDYLFAPTSFAQNILLEEGIGKKDILYYGKISKPKIFLTGNTIVDTIIKNLDKAKNSKILSELGLTSGEYFLLTLHREENVDHKDRLLGILKGLQNVEDYHKIPIVYPIHPRTKKRIEEFKLTDELNKIKNLKIIDPVGFFDLLALESNAKLVLTDSGGIQEETCSLKVPCVVLRDRSDRPESLEVGAAMLAGCDPRKILDAVNKMIKSDRNWKNPFGDGKAAERIVNILIEMNYNKT